MVARLRSFVSDRRQRRDCVLAAPDATSQVVVLTIQNGGHVEPSLRFHYGRFYRRIVGASCAA